MIQSFAPLVSRVSGTTDATLIQSGRPIKVFGMIFTRSSTTTVNFTIADANGNTLWVATLAGTVIETISDEIPWLADKGIQITMDQTTGECVVFHSHEGT